MILVSMRLHSARDGHTEVLCSVRITNDGTGTPEVGNYDWQIHSKSGTVIREGRLEGWRKKSKSPGQLLAQVMREAYP